MVTNKKPYKTVLLHRYIWENSNNARLLPWSIVHHIDEDVHNNTPSNLEAMMRNQHFKTWSGRVKKRIPLERVCDNCGSNKTSFRKTNGILYADWRRFGDKFHCAECYQYYYYWITKK